MADPHPDPGTSPGVTAKGLDHEQKRCVEALQALPLREFESWLAGQRWFRSKGQPLRGVKVRDCYAESLRESLVLLSFLEVTTVNQSELYFVPFLALGPNAEKSPDLIARLPSGDIFFREAFQERLFLEWFLKWLFSGDVLKLAEGRIEAKENFSPGPGNLGKESIRLLGAEQSNTTLRAGQRHIIKIIRKMESGISPENEMLSYLTKQGFEGVPALYRDWTFRQADHISSFAFLQAFVESESDGWKNTVTRLSRLLDEAIHRDGSSEARALMPEFVRDFHHLGRTTGAMHRLLALSSDDARFQPEPVRSGDYERWKEGHLSMAKEAFDGLEDELKRHREPAAAIRNQIGELLARRSEIGVALDSLRELASEGVRKIRFHGDYHLGQVLKGADRWYVIDFEGEPLRSLGERKMKSCPLRDVAGMLRSINYAGFVAFQTVDGTSQGRYTGRLQEIRRSWEAAVREAFLKGYFQETGQNAVFLSAQPGRTAEVLRALQLEKAVYELNYEIRNRPEWVHVPVLGILSLLGERAGNDRC